MNKLFSPGDWVFWRGSEIRGLVLRRHKFFEYYIVYFKWEAGGRWDAAEGLYHVSKLTPA